MTGSDRLADIVKRATPEALSTAFSLVQEIGKAYPGNETIWFVIRDIQTAVKAKDASGMYAALDKDPGLKIPEILSSAYVQANKLELADWLVEMTANYLATHPGRVNDYAGDEK